MYLHKFSGNFHKNWSAGNSLVARDHLVLPVDGSGALIVSKMAMCDQGEFWVVWGGLALVWVYLDFSSNFRKNWSGGNGNGLVVRDRCISLGYPRCKTCIGGLKRIWVGQEKVMSMLV